MIEADKVPEGASEDEANGMLAVAAVSAIMLGLLGCYASWARSRTHSSWKNAALTLGTMIGIGGFVIAAFFCLILAGWLEDTLPPHPWSASDEDDKDSTPPPSFSDSDQRS